MNIKYLAILMAVASLSLSGCSFRTTESGYSFKAKVITQGGYHTLIAECIPKESVTELTFKDDFLARFLFGISGESGNDQDQKIELTRILAALGDSKTAKAAQTLLAAQSTALGVLNETIKNGKLPCPPKSATKTVTLEK